MSFEIMGVTSDEVQDMLPQNMAPWHTEYFKLKESEQMVEVSLWPSPNASHLKWVIKPSLKVLLSSLAPKVKGHGTES